MILCLGMSSSGKSVLLKSLQKRNVSQLQPVKKQQKDILSGNEDSKQSMSSVPTVGTNLVTLTKFKGKKSSNQIPEIVTIREVGGTMAPLWHSYIECGRTKGVLYVIDVSRPDLIGASTIHLIELLNQNGLESAQAMIVFTKSENPGIRTLQEIKSLMRLDQIVNRSKQMVMSSVFKSDDPESNKDIYDWCMRFCMPKEN